MSVVHWGVGRREVRPACHALSKHPVVMTDQQEDATCGNCRRVCSFENELAALFEDLVAHAMSEWRRNVDV